MVDRFYGKRFMLDPFNSVAYGNNFMSIMLCVENLLDELIEKVVQKHA